MAIGPIGDGLVMVMLRYADELRQAEDYFNDIPQGKPEKEMLDLAVELIGRKTAAFDASKFEDHYSTALQALIQDKLKGRRIVAHAEEARAPRGNVVDLMEALRRSVGSAKKAAEKISPKETKQRSDPKTPRRRAG